MPIALDIYAHQTGYIYSFAHEQFSEVCKKYTHIYNQTHIKKLFLLIQMYSKPAYCLIKIHEIRSNDG